MRKAGGIDLPTFARLGISSSLHGIVLTALLGVPG